MPTAAANITHITYPDTHGGGPVQLEGVRLHTSKAAALEYAVDEGQKYVPVRAGETIADAIARYTAERSQQKAITAGPTPRRVRDEPQA